MSANVPTAARKAAQRDAQLAWLSPTGDQGRSDAELRAGPIEEAWSTQFARPESPRHNEIFERGPGSGTLTGPMTFLG